eukprot:TRINITY_DN9228_c0_g1_i1.p1 TRINITY_DN9228_c0_g1~~TRINITY_DN9228_c0_g1_i1.p1  ORF type:complete len:818 (-),score=94.96 TRINITY_DN9228_c0_g1_i1:382-2547(-)
MTVGIHHYQQWYSGLFWFSTFEDFQVFLHDNPTTGVECPMPCSTTTTSTTVPLGTSPCPQRGAIPNIPANVVDYNGISWPGYCFTGLADEHVFIIGDWGGVLSRDSTGIRVATADNTHDKDDMYVERGFVWGVDNQAQRLVANRMIGRAMTHRPRYVLNVGDNFYWGGIDDLCGRVLQKFEHLHEQWKHVFEDMYGGSGLQGKPWFSVLGNHDFGGYQFNKAWDQQIAYTWRPNSRWILPGLYWHQHVDYPTKNFSIDYFMVDTNVNDAKHPYHDPGHNICSLKHNGDKSCAPFGPRDPWDCWRWFGELWEKQLAWLDRRLSESTADWQIVVTHFPPELEYRGWQWRALTEKYGIDLFVVGHRHQQEMHSSSVAGAPVVVTGGGGGITSEHNPNSWGRQDQYGYMDMTISSAQALIEGFNHVGKRHNFMMIYPKDGWYQKMLRQGLAQNVNMSQNGFADQSSSVADTENELSHEAAHLVPTGSCDSMGRSSIEDRCSGVFEGARVKGVLWLAVSHGEAFAIDRKTLEAIQHGVASLAGIKEVRDVFVVKEAAHDSVKTTELVVLRSQPHLTTLDPVQINFTIELPREDMKSEVAMALHSNSPADITVELLRNMRYFALERYDVRATGLSINEPNLLTMDEVNHFALPPLRSVMLIFGVVLWIFGSVAVGFILFSSGRHGFATSTTRNAVIGSTEAETETETDDSKTDCSSEEDVEDSEDEE